MNSSRLTWQLPALILLSLPLWQGAMARFLTLDQGPLATPLHQDSSFLLEEVLFTQNSRDSLPSPLQPGGDGELESDGTGGEGLTLRAQRVHGSDQGSSFNLEGADLRRSGPRPLHLTGEQASFDPERQVLTLLGAVVVETADLVVRTPVMRYLVKYETLKSAAEVELAGKGMTLTGTSFMYNLKSGGLRVGERVRFHYTPPQSADTH